MTDLSDLSLSGIFFYYFGIAVSFFIGYCILYALTRAIVKMLGCK